jgi:hypothetical protein
MRTSSVVCSKSCRATLHCVPITTLGSPPALYRVPTTSHILRLSKCSSLGVQHLCRFSAYSLLGAHHFLRHTNHSPLVFATSEGSPQILHSVPGTSPGPLPTLNWVPSPSSGLDSLPPKLYTKPITIQPTACYPKISSQTPYLWHK